jgi:L,D-transpeptidase-like protein
MRRRVWIAAGAAIVLVAAGLAGAAVFAWPHAKLRPSADALARISFPSYGGHVTEVTVRRADGSRVPVQVRGREIWPQAKLESGERLTVSLTVRRPGWAGWLVGRHDVRTFTVETPAAHLRGRWLQVKPGALVTIAFDGPVGEVAFGRTEPRQLARPQRVVPLGVRAQGVHSAGAVLVAAAARSWERLPAPVRVSWFPARPYPQLLVQPKEGSTIAPNHRLTLTFSRPVEDVLGSRRPPVTPATAGRWSLVDAHTLAFQPTGLGFGLGADVHVSLPRRVHVFGAQAARLTRTLVWHVPEGSMLRLQQLLAQLGYLPVSWEADGDAPAQTASAQLAAAIAPPAGRFTWRYPNTPSELQSQWHAGKPNEITRGAVMMFEDTHDLDVDGLAGPKVWRAVLEAALSGEHRSSGYSYVYVHRNLPQSLNLWHNGAVVLSSPGNTGVPAAPTTLGTFPVFEHIQIGTMSGTNPDGTHYHDPGIRWISYFHGGDAIHSFNRASFGTPQSLGCVELPLAAAAKVWPFTPIGTLVTIEN